MRFKVVSLRSSFAVGAARAILQYSTRWSGFGEVGGISFFFFFSIVALEKIAVVPLLSWYSCRSFFLSYQDYQEFCHDNSGVSQE